MILVPADVRNSARKALALKPLDVPEVTFRLASGWCETGDIGALALWYLDNVEHFKAQQCTLAAALRGGRAGRQWALASPTTIDFDYERLLNNVTRSDQLLVPQLSTAIMVAWERQIDHAARKARSRLARSTEGRQVDFNGFPNHAATMRAGIDDLMDKAWDAFRVSVATILANYARTQVATVAVVDPIAAESVRHQIETRSDAAVASLVAFMDTRMREFMLGTTPYEPQDFPAGRAVAAWVSGALPAPDGYTFVDLSAVGKLTITKLTTAQTTLLALAGATIARSLTWVHGFYGEPLQPFQPHEDIDHRVLTVAQAADLGVYPGDHNGCRCELVTSWGKV